MYVCVFCFAVQFVCVESLSTAITDMFPEQLRRAGRREILVLAIVVVCFLLGLPLVTQGGIKLFQLMDIYGASGTNLLFIACFETVVIGWIYGANRFYDNIEDMIGYRPFPVLKYCWLFITPLICGITLTYDLMTTVHIKTFYDQDSWTKPVAALLVITPLLCIPLHILISTCRNLKGTTTPSSDLQQAWPYNPVLTLCEYVIYPGQEKPPRTVHEDYEKFSTTGV